MNSNSTNLSQSYDIALENASGIQRECQLVAENYSSSSPLFRVPRTKDVVVTVICLVLGTVFTLMGIASLVAADQPFYLFGIPFPPRFASLYFFGLGVALVFTSGFYLYRVRNLSKAKRSAKDVEAISAAVGEEAKKLPAFDKQMKEAIESGNDMTIQPSGFWETLLNQHKSFVRERAIKDEKTYQLIHTIASCSILLFALLASFRFVIGGYLREYDAASGPVVAISYVSIGVILGEALLRLVRYYHIKTKIIAAAIFGIYQLLVVIVLAFSNGFASIPMAPDGTTRPAIYSYPIISLLLFTVVIVLIIFLPNYSELCELMKEKMDVGVPMDDGSTSVNVLPIHPANMIRRRCLLLLPVFLTMGVWMGNIINEKTTFWYVLLYILIMIIYFFTAFVLDSSDWFVLFYGRLTRLYRYLLFACYVTTVLDSVDTFKAGTLVLLAISMLGGIGGYASDVMKGRKSKASSEANVIFDVNDLSAVSDTIDESGGDDNINE